MTDYRKLFDLAGKTAVVLGAASGIGKSSAEALAALGASVLCADRSLDGAQATVAGIREHGGVAEAAACDASSAADVANLARRAQQKFPRLDIAVTTPGLNIRKTILDYTEEDLDRVINLKDQPFPRKPSERIPVATALLSPGSSPFGQRLTGEHLLFGDGALCPAVSEEGDQPVREYEHPVLEPGQLHEVHKQPEHPCRDAGDVQPADMPDSPKPADGGQRPGTAIAKRLRAVVT